MVLKQQNSVYQARQWFENDVNMYGTQARCRIWCKCHVFENDVNMYGTQARLTGWWMDCQFENDVNMYGTQAQMEVVRP